MTTRTLHSNVLEIHSAPGLDTIHVYWLDLGVGQGHVTITCFGNAWTAYFGAMGGRSVKKFFAGGCPDYLVNKLGYSQVLKSRKKDLEYLERIVRAVQAALAE